MRLSDELSKPEWLFKKVIPNSVAFCIFAFVVFIFFPRFPHVTEKPRQSSCLSNEKQIALSLIAYAQDNDEHLPLVEKWIDVTQPYLPSSKESTIYHCPSVTDNKTDPSYAFDDNVAAKDRQKISNAVQVRMMYESTKTVRNAHDAGTSLPVPGRHVGGNNISYVDGHAKWIKDGSVPPSNTP